MKSEYIIYIIVKESAIETKVVSYNVFILCI